MGAQEGGHGSSDVSTAWYRLAWFWYIVGLIIMTYITYIHGFLKIQTNDKLKEKPLSFDEMSP